MWRGLEVVITGLTRNFGRTCEFRPPPILLDTSQHWKSQNRIFFAFSPVFSPTNFWANFWKENRMKIDTESCPSGRRCSTRNAVSRKASRVQIPNSPPHRRSKVRFAPAFLCPNSINLHFRRLSICFQNFRPPAEQALSPSPVPRWSWTCNPSGRRYSP